MYDKSLVKIELNQILDAISTIQDRFAPIAAADDFISQDDGLMRLDSICMWIIAIGENVKAIDKRTRHQLLPQYPDIPWKRVMGIRDVLSHHYFERDAEVIYDVCATDLPTLATTTLRILNDLGE